MIEDIEYDFINNNLVIKTTKKMVFYPFDKITEVKIFKKSIKINDESYKKEEDSIVGEKLLEILTALKQTSIIRLLYSEFANYDMYSYDELKINYQKYIKLLDIFKEYISELKRNGWKNYISFIPKAKKLIEMENI